MYPLMRDFHRVSWYVYITEGLGVYVLSELFVVNALPHLSHA
jgi:hypothetical protein